MNLFARELAAVLAAHGKELSSLFSLHSGDITIPPSKVTRLKRSLEEDTTATLNAEELAILQAVVPLIEGEMRRLKAALVAESVHHVLAGRMDTRLATEAADFVLQLLLADTGRDMAAIRDHVLTLIREVQSPPPTPDARRDMSHGLPEPDLVAAHPIVAALEPAEEALARSELWLALARDAPTRQDRQGYLAQTRQWLQRAQDLATHPATVAVGTLQQTDLLARVQTTMTAADRVG